MIKGMKNQAQKPTSRPQPKQHTEPSYELSEVTDTKCWMWKFVPLMLTALDTACQPAATEDPPPERNYTRIATYPLFR